MPSNSTVVTGTIVDRTGTVWANATITPTFVPNPNTAQTPVWAGGGFNTTQPTVTASGSGTFSLTIPSNAFIIPGINLWNFTICPKSSTYCGTVTVYVNGDSMDISAVITPNLPYTIIPTNLIRVDNLGQIINPAIGAIIFNNITGVPNIWNGSIWTTLGGGGSSGSQVSSITTKTSAYTLTGSDYTIKVDATSGPLVVTLPTLPATGQVFNIKKVDASANTVTINGNGKVIDGSATLILTVQYQDYTIQYDGTTWSII